jgi:hypothetical protein
MTVLSLFAGRDSSDLNFPSRALTRGRFFDICIQGRKIQLLELSLKTRVSSYRFPGPESLVRGGRAGTD